MQKTLSSLAMTIAEMIGAILILVAIGVISLNKK